MLVFSLSSNGAIGVSKLPLIAGLALKEGQQSTKWGGEVEGGGSLLHKLQPPAVRTHIHRDTHTHPWRRIRLSINHLAEDAVLFIWL